MFLVCTGVCNNANRNIENARMSWHRCFQIAQGFVPTMKTKIFNSKLILSVYLLKKFSMHIFVKVWPWISWPACNISIQLSPCFVQIIKCMLRMYSNDCLEAKRMKTVLWIIHKQASKIIRIIRKAK